MDRTELSKLLSLVLRHAPDRFGVHLDRNGWADVAELLSRLAEHGTALTRAQLEDVATPRRGEKHRFELDGPRIRARYGHSVDVDYDVEVSRPPRVLFHGTPERNVDAIRQEGLSSEGRRKVHLSEDVETARQVGARRGRPVVLEIDTTLMGETTFQRLAGGIWLVDRVPPEAIVGPTAR